MTGRMIIPPPKPIEPEKNPAMKPTTMRITYIDIICYESVIIHVSMLLLAGIGLLGFMHTVCGMKARPQHFLLGLAVPFFGGLDVIVQSDAHLGFFSFLLHLCAILIEIQK